MTELSVNAAKSELSANAAEFQFSGRLLFLSHVKQPNFSEFHRIFLNFLKIDGISHLRIFCSA
jgi:hypothetical protein